MVYAQCADTCHHVNNAKAYLLTEFVHLGMLEKCQLELTPRTFLPD